MSTSVDALNNSPGHYLLRPPALQGLDASRLMSTPKLASAPFDSASADLKLHSCDGVEFRVHKVVLQMATPFFENILAMPQSPHTNTINGIPIIPFEEHSSTLDALLRYCYPVPDPVIQEFTTLEDILKACHKFDFTAVTARMEKEYLRICAHVVRDSPCAAFALACQYKWSIVARAAAEASLLHKMDDLVREIPSLAYPLDADDFFQLFKYHVRCREVIRDVCNRLSIESKQEHYHPYVEDDMRKLRFCHTLLIGSEDFPLSWANHIVALGRQAMDSAPRTFVLSSALIIGRLPIEKSECQECQDININAHANGDAIQKVIEEKSKDGFRDVNDLCYSQSRMIRTYDDVLCRRSGL
ncbi:hypothetical protein ONZ45_g11803 [Pleurotus djamor]|nr:hypothetical protein ONZ45_g11803 [Pleurotus djamor]